MLESNADVPPRSETSKKLEKQNDDFDDYQN